MLSQQTRDVEPVFIYCWANVADDGPALNQSWPNCSCLLGLPLLLLYVFEMTLLTIFVDAADVAAAAADDDDDAAAVVVTAFDVAACFSCFHCCSLFTTVV